jgi:glycosidase
MPAPRLLLLLCGLAIAACAASAVEQPSVTPTPPVTPDTLPIAFLHDPQNATHLSAASGALSIRFRANPGRVTAAVVEANGLTGVMQPQFRYRGQDVWRGTLPQGVASYRIRVTTTRGDSTFGPFTVPTGVFSAVNWVGSSVGYQIFPERFQNGDPSNDALTLSTDEHAFMPQWAVPQLRPWRGAPVTEQLCCHDYFGGDLAGITQRLDSLRAIGVTMLYLNPIFSSGSAHGYDTYDYLQVEPSFGTEATLRTLLDAAHARSMRVLFDFVPNHVGLGFPRFQDAVRTGPTSPSWSWFTFNVPAAQIQIGNPAHYATFAGSGAMPKLNTANPDVLNYLMQVARTWMQFGFDGIRVDVPNELPNAAAFARALRTTAKSVKPDAYVVGEIWDRAPSWVQGDQYDALMNYAVGQAIIEPFAKGTMTGSDAADNLGLVFMEYPEASTAMAFNVIATHDTPRLLTKLGAGPLGTSPAPDQLARQRLASAMLFALPGVPLTFQGDECAFTGAMNENRYPVQWDQCDAPMRAHYTQLAALRTSTPALTSSAFRIAGSGGNYIAWLRGESGPGEVLAIFNAGLAPMTYQLPAGTWQNLLSQSQVSTSVSIPQQSWLYLKHL